MKTKQKTSPYEGILKFKKNFPSFVTLKFWRIFPKKEKKTKKIQN
jgi:hypothetical protein